MIVILLKQIYGYIAPYLLPIVTVIMVLALVWGCWEHVEIYGIHIKLPIFGEVALISGYKTDADNAVKNYNVCKENRVKLQTALDDQSFKLKQAQQRRAAQDQATNNDLAPKVAALQADLNGKDTKIKALQAMVGNIKFGADACTRAQNIINQSIGLPLVGVKP